MLYPLVAAVCILLLWVPLCSPVLCSSICSQGFVVEGLFQQRHPLSHRLTEVLPPPTIHNTIQEALEGDGQCLQGASELPLSFSSKGIRNCPTLPLRRFKCLQTEKQRAYLCDIERKQLFLGDALYEGQNNKYNGCGEKKVLLLGDILATILIAYLQNIPFFVWAFRTQYKITKMFLPLSINYHQITEK